MAKQPKAKVFHQGDFVYFVNIDEVLRGFVLSEFGLCDHTVSVIYDRHGDDNYRIADVPYADVFEHKCDAEDALNNKKLDLD